MLLRRAAMTGDREDNASLSLVSFFRTTYTETKDIIASSVSCFFFFFASFLPTIPVREIKFIFRREARRIVINFL